MRDLNTRRTSRQNQFKRRDQAQRARPAAQPAAQQNKAQPQPQQQQARPAAPQQAQPKPAAKPQTLAKRRRFHGLAEQFEEEVNRLESSTSESDE